MSRCRPTLLVQLLYAGTIVSTCSLWAAPAAHARWPRWPTELAQQKKTLENLTETKGSQRLHALKQLTHYDAAVIEPLVLGATHDPDPSVQTFAFGLCERKQIAACVPLAREAYTRQPQPALLMSILGVVAMQPRGESLAVLLDVLGHSPVSVQKRALELLGESTPGPDETDEIRQRLIGLLAGPQPALRAQAVIALSNLVPESCSLVFLRTLEDSDPSVREAAAVGLARAKDTRTLDPTIRALERSSSISFQKQLLRAVATIPGKDTQLLGYLDSPPGSLTRTNVVDSFLYVDSPSEALIDGLIRRTEESLLRDEALKALHYLGPPVVHPLRQRLALQLPADLQNAYRAIVRSRQSPPADSSTDAQITTASDSISLREFAHNNSSIQARSRQRRFLLKWLSTADSPGQTASLGDPSWLSQILLSQTQLGKSIATRCLATVAIAKHYANLTDEHPNRDVLAAHLELASRAPNAEIRACSSLGAYFAVPSSKQLLHLLYDSSPRVRATAAMVLATMPSSMPGSTSGPNSDPTISRLKYLEQFDESPAVRMNAQAATASWQASPLGSWESIIDSSFEHSDMPLPNFRRESDHRWATQSIDGQVVVTPVIGSPSSGWALRFKSATTASLAGHVTR